MYIITVGFSSIFSTMRLTLGNPFNTRFSLSVENDELSMKMKMSVKMTMSVKMKMSVKMSVVMMRV